jgi:small redox-active disulfide protein 2
MGLFKKDKKEDITGFTCTLCTPNNEIADLDVNIDEKITCIKVLGAGCPSCHKQYEYVMETVNKLGLDVKVEFVEDFDEVIKYEVMAMPAIVINEKVITSGKILKPQAVEKLLR